MFKRFSHSFELVRFSAGVLRQDKELLVFPLMSSIAAICVLASFIPVFAVGGEFVAGGQTMHAEGTMNADEGIDMVLVGLIYLLEYFVIFFFNTALVGAALIRMRGGDPTVGDGLRIATGKISGILGYAMIAATVGLVLRVISERVGFVGRLVVGLLGAGWTVATYLTVPVLVSRDVGPIDAVRESVSLLKATWGENVIASAGLGMFFYLVYFVVIGVFVFLATTFANGVSGELLLGWVGLCVLILLLIGLIQAALQGIFSAALYHYAVDGNGDNEGGAGDAMALVNAFAPK